jgi:soluble lytic murein transglycosylase-like protein
MRLQQIYRLLAKPSLALALAGAATSTLHAGEYAILATGFRIHAESHEQSGAMIRLHTASGVTEIPADSIDRFEDEEYQSPAAAITPSAAVSPDGVTKPKATPSDPQTLVRDAAVRSGLPPALVSSVAAIESSFRPDAISPKGAIGVMQLMPATAKALSADPRDTAQNIDAGTRLLRELLIKYDGDVVKALSAYNAGSAAVDRYKGMPPYAETQEYVYKVVKAYLKNGGK